MNHQKVSVKTPQIIKEKSGCAAWCFSVSCSFFSSCSFFVYLTLTRHKCTYRRSQAELDIFAPYGHDSPEAVHSTQALQMIQDLGLSTGLYSFMACVLKQYPPTRSTVEELLHHPWFQGVHHLSSDDIQQLECLISHSAAPGPPIDLPLQPKNDISDLSYIFEQPEQKTQPNVPSSDAQTSPIFTSHSFTLSLPTSSRSSSPGSTSYHTVLPPSTAVYSSQTVHPISPSERSPTPIPLHDVSIQIIGLSTQISSLAQEVNDIKHSLDELKQNQQRILDILNSLASSRPQDIKAKDRVISSGSDLRHLRSSQSAYLNHI